MKHILFMRHSKSDWSTGEPDFDRPLNERGKAESLLMGRWFNTKGLKPDYIVASPAKRARKTARRVAEVIGFNTDNILWNDKLYFGDEFDYIRCLKSLPDNIQCVLVVGHNPSIELAVMKLISNVEDGKEMKTSTIASIFTTVHCWKDLIYNQNTLDFIIYPADVRHVLEATTT